MDEGEIKRVELESGNLQKLIAEVEAALAASTPGTRGLLLNALRNAKAHMLALEERTKEAERERAEHERGEASVIALAQREAALSAKEKETFSGFLKEDYFTKKDFSRLTEFYAHTWDRLSERGKDEMSHRIWEGIRKEQYTFAELPPEVREKEMNRAYTALTKQSGLTTEVSQIPEKDRTDFTRSYEAGEHDEAMKILQRASFKEEMSRVFRPSQADNGKQTEANLAIVQKSVASGQLNKPRSENSPEAIAAGRVDLSSFDFGGMKVADNAPAVSAPSVNDSTGPDSRTR